MFQSEIEHSSLVLHLQHVQNFVQQHHNIVRVHENVWRVKLPSTLRVHIFAGRFSAQITKLSSEKLVKLVKVVKYRRIAQKLVEIGKSQ